MKTKKILLDHQAKRLIIKMLHLGSVVDPVVVNVTDNERISLIDYIETNFDSNKENTYISLTENQLRNLSQILDAVNVVVEETFIGFEDVPRAETMDEVTQMVSDWYFQIDD